jgi:hypothetical protein
MKQITRRYVNSVLRSLKTSGHLRSRSHIGGMTNFLANWICFAHEQGWSKEQATMFCQELLRKPEKKRKRL